MGYFNCGANIVTIKKEDKKYGMCCAWAMQTDYDKVMLMVGSQSITGTKMKIGDLIGVSALSVGQEDVALMFGCNHSNEVDKFQSDNLYEKNEVVLVKGAKSALVCKINKIFDLEGTNDLLVYASVVEESINNTDFLDYMDIKY